MDLAYYGNITLIDRISLFRENLLNQLCGIPGVFEYYNTNLLNSGLKIHQESSSSRFDKHLKYMENIVGPLSSTLSGIAKVESDPEQRANASELVKQLVSVNTIDGHVNAVKRAVESVKNNIVNSKAEISKLK